MNDYKETEMTKMIKYLSAKFQGIFSSAQQACSTRMINDQFFECKVKKPNPRYCEHSLSSGDGFICRHADRKEYVGK